MKFTDTLDYILGHKSKIRILRYLLKSGLELTGREVSRAIGMHHRTCHTALKELASLGVVLMHQAGRAAAYKINNNNLLVEKALRPIFQFESSLLFEAIKDMRKITRSRIISAIVFGSVASSSERGTSDVDILFLTASKGEKNNLIKNLEKIGYGFILKYGNMLSPLVLTMDEFYSRLRQKDQLVQNIIREGRPIFGMTIQEVLIKCQRKK